MRAVEEEGREVFAIREASDRLEKVDVTPLFCGGSTWSSLRESDIQASLARNGASWTDRWPRKRSYLAHEGLLPHWHVRAGNPLRLHAVTPRSQAAYET